MKHCVIRFELAFDAAFHLGSGRDAPGIDDLVARDSGGVPYVRGSSLAGVMRAEATRLAPHLFDEAPCHRVTGSDGVCTCSTCDLFGSWRAGGGAPGQHDNQPDLSHASPLTVHHACPSGMPRATVADRVSISRRTGAAEEHRKFNFELLEPDHPFTAVLEVTAPSARQLQLLEAVLAEFRTGRVAIGGRSGGGLGWLTISDPKCIEPDLRDHDVLCTWLEHDAREPADFNLFGPRPFFAGSLSVKGRVGVPRPAFVDVSFEVSFLEHELIADPALAALELTHGKHLRRIGGELYIPGFSQRGALRARAERILRTLREDLPLNLVACDPLDRSPTSNTRSCAARIRQMMTDQPARGLHAIAEEQTCLACQLFGHEYKGGLIRIADARIMQRAADQHIDYVAIDRFTGGVRSGAKFDVEAVCAPKFTGRIVLHDHDDWMAGLLLLALRDLIEGDLPLGGKTRRGMGRALGSITAWTEGTLGNPVPEWVRAGGAVATSGAFATAAWEGLPCPGAPNTFLSGNAAALRSLDERYVAPLVRKLAETRVRERMSGPIATAPGQTAVPEETP